MGRVDAVVDFERDKVDLPDSEIPVDIDDGEDDCADKR